MEIEVTQDKLARALNVVSKVAMGAKSTLPILSNVLIRAEGERVTLTTTNLDMAVVDFVPVSNSKDGVITVPARLLAEFVQNLPKGEKIKLTVDGYKMKICAGKYSSVINGVMADDFPELPDIDEKKAVIFRMDVDEFKAGISEVIIAASGDTTRPALTGVYFKTLEGALHIAASDGYRLAEKEFVDKVKSEVAAIVPASSLREVLSSIPDDAEEIEFLFDDNQVRFRVGEVEVMSKLIDGAFPDFLHIIPKNNEVKVILEREELVRIVKMASLFARETNRAITCEAKAKEGVFVVSSISSEVGENKSEIETKIEKDGKVKVDSHFLMVALGAMVEEKVEIEFMSMGNTPVLITNEKDKKYKHIVMPLEQA